MVAYLGRLIIKFLSHKSHEFKYGLTEILFFFKKDCEVNFYFAVLL